MTETNLKAVKTRIICKKTERKDTTDSGIFVGSGQSTEEDQWATVVSIGSEVKIEIKIGDQIVPMWQNCAVITENKEKYFVVDETNVLAVKK